MERQQILATIYSTIDEVNASQPEGARIVAAESTMLFGPGAALDSLGLVTFVVALEQSLAREHGLQVTLADEKAMSQRTSPFRSVATLADYVEQLARAPR
jgi:acyl carrier protein